MKCSLQPKKIFSFNRVLDLLVCVLFFFQKTLKFDYLIICIIDQCQPVLLPLVFMDNSYSESCCSHSSCGASSARRQVSPCRSRGWFSPHGQRHPCPFLKESHGLMSVRARLGLTAGWELHQGILCFCKFVCKIYHMDLPHLYRRLLSYGVC